MGPAGGTINQSPVSLWVVPDAVKAPTQIDVQPDLSGPEYQGVPATWVFSLTATDDGSGDPADALSAPSLLTVDWREIDIRGANPAQLRIAQLSDGAWTVLAATSNGGVLAAWITDFGTYAVLEEPTIAVITVQQDSDAPSAGLHRVDPGALLTVTVTVTPQTKLYRGSLVTGVPAGWRVGTADGGTWDAGTREVTWPLPITRPGTTIVHVLTLTAPDAAAMAAEGLGSASDARFSTRVDQPGATPTDAPDLILLVSPVAVVDHVLLGRVDAADDSATYLATDASMDAQPVFDVFRVRFRVENPDTIAVAIGAPALEFRLRGAGDDAWQPVPGPATPGDRAFRVASERADYATQVVPLARADARMADASGRSLGYADGFRAEGVNPGPALALPGGAAAEVEFSVSATVFAKYLATYEFRLVGGGSDAGDASGVAASAPDPLDGMSARAVVTIGPEPAAALSAGQRTGSPVGAVRYQLNVPGSSGLLGAPVTPSGASGPIAAALPPGSPHGDISLSTDSCGACHRAHTAQGSNLLRSIPRSARSASPATTGWVPARAPAASGRWPRPTIHPRRPTTSTPRPRRTAVTPISTTRSSRPSTTATASARTATTRTIRWTRTWHRRRQWAAGRSPGR